jgi:hypothetical protein
MQHARQLDVIQVAPLPAQQAIELAARNARTDAGTINRRMLRHYDLSALRMPPPFLASISAAIASMIA